MTESTHDQRQVSVVIPVLNDAFELERLLKQLAPLAVAVCVVDGGSVDGSDAVAERFGGCLVRSEPGRGQQLQAGLEHIKTPWVWCLHADTQGDLRAALSQLLRCRQPTWGWFDVQLDSPSSVVRGVAWMMNRRARWSQIATGDQGMFVHRDLLLRIGGVPRQTLMEDIELSRRLKRIQPATPLVGPLLASARRWHRNGVWRTIIKMWWLRGRYFFGADPAVLAREYYR